MSRKFQRSLFIKPSKDGGWKFYALILISLALLLCAAIFLWPVVPATSNVDKGSAYKVKITPQSGLSAIAAQLSEQGVSTNVVSFQVAARALFVSSKLKPGTYLLAPRASLGNILLQIARGDRVRESVAIIPGMTIWQLRNLIDKHPALIHQTKGMSSKELLKTIGLTYSGDEGLFYPDTYIFDPDDSDTSIYRRASQAMQKQLTAAWEQRDSATPLKTPYELLILASIVEKETGRSSDRSLVSAVFVNRLNLKMPLQTDPTVIYGIGPKFDGNLRKTDLRIDSPYNTYMHKGLPPTPIAMPSKESLLAVMHPAKSDAIYFVARGDGSSHFSKTLKEHESAVDQFQRKRNSSNQSKSQ
ncbi:endolytic transglycosylase MltG [Polynucleobacter sp. AP-Elch-400A-B2]|uniref:endolytic transglycosylase MltG n=1 Tax=Polynucleobacter sp. AP-Elch-400A-B2 TaxID=2576930 RepID=UPI001BFDA66F|nr:endolytic transglycosylase MltG [Polynucleobacter sp. AP-Elch-400A-B2]QWE23761.1 endolytic transglycosylase MltG [Polynucleobacter sp. AP-Elch-400A-B2]